MITSIYKFLTDPKNRRMLVLAAFVILGLLFLQQCTRTQKLKDQVEFERQEKQRVQNNYDAAMDTIQVYQVNDSTLRAEKLGYSLTIDELKKDYSDLLGDYEYEKNKPPKTITITEIKIVEKMVDVPFLVYADDSTLTTTFADSSYFSQENYRFINGKFTVYYEIDTIRDTILTKPKSSEINLTQGIGLRTILKKDLDSKKIIIEVETEYPNVVFTKIEGADIMSNDVSRKTARSLRKNWGIGINLGYGFNVNPATGTVSMGPSVGVGISWRPKFLQW